MAVSSFRDPFDTACSLVKKDGNVQRDMCEKVCLCLCLYLELVLVCLAWPWPCMNGGRLTCSPSLYFVLCVFFAQVLCEQNAFYHPPVVKVGDKEVRQALHFTAAL